MAERASGAGTGHVETVAVGRVRVTAVDHERERAERLLDAPEPPPAYARWVRRRRVKAE